MQRSLSATIPFHYGWIIMIAGTFSIFACLGLGRFSLGMLLPSMGQALQLSYSQMGLISTANLAGYLVAVLLSSKIMKIAGAKNLIALSLVVIGVSMILICQTTSMVLITGLYIITGVGSALANVPTMALIAAWFSSNIRGRASGYVIIGNGFAIILSGRLIPYLNSNSETGWQASWLVLGIIVLCCALFCFFLLKNSPTDLNLQPVGQSNKKLPESPKHSEQITTDIPIQSKFVWHCAAIYFLYGFTYIIYVTFIVTSMVQDHGYSEAIAGTFWSWVGALSLFSGPFFGALSDKFGRKSGLITVFFIQCTAYLLVALPLPKICLFLSISCYGIVAWSVPTIISALVADYAGHQRVAAIFGFVTFVFGIGQISGPYLAGLLAEKSGDFSSSFFMAFCMALLAIIVSIYLPGKEK